MKPEFPILYAKASLIIAIPIIAITVCFYIAHAIYLSPKDVYPMAITAFGATAALSGLCFAMAPTKTGDPPIRYAGEKFLHSALLLIQTMIVIYAKDAILTLSIINTHRTIKSIFASIFISAITLVSTIVGVICFHGFSKLNKDLWNKMERRIEISRKSKE